MGERKPGGRIAASLPSGASPILRCHRAVTGRDNGVTRPRAKHPRCRTGRRSVGHAAARPRRLRSLALEQAAANLVSRADLDGGSGPATRADPVAADQLAVGTVVEHGEHFPLARGAPVGRFRVRLHRSLHDRTEEADGGGRRVSVTDPGPHSAGATLAAMRSLLPGDRSATLDAYLDELDRWASRLNLTSIPREHMWDRNVAEVEELLGVTSPPPGLCSSTSDRVAACRESSSPSFDRISRSPSSTQISARVDFSCTSPGCCGFQTCEWRRFVPRTPGAGRTCASSTTW